MPPRLLAVGGYTVPEEKLNAVDKPFIGLLLWTDTTQKNAHLNTSTSAQHTSNQGGGTSSINTNSAYVSLQCFQQFTSAIYVLLEYLINSLTSRALCFLIFKLTRNILVPAVDVSVALRQTSARVIPHYLGHALASDQQSQQSSSQKCSHKPRSDHHRASATTK